MRSATGVLGLDRAHFASAVLTDMPPRPANYLAIIAANRRRGAGDDVGELEVGANNCAAG